MGPKLDLRSEVDFKQAALQKFYNYLDKRIPGKWSRFRTGELLEIFEQRCFRHSWEAGLKPFLQYRYASDLMASPYSDYDTLGKAVNIFRKALHHPSCPEFLKPKIMFQQAESYRTGRGRDLPDLCQAAQLYTKIIEMPATTRELWDRAHDALHALLYNSAEPELQRLNQAHRIEKAALQADLMTARQATRVFQIRSARLEEERAKADAKAQKFQHENAELRRLLQEKEALVKLTLEQRAVEVLAYFYVDNK